MRKCKEISRRESGLIPRLVGFTGGVTLWDSVKVIFFEESRMLAL